VAEKTREKQVAQQAGIELEEPSVTGTSHGITGGGGDVGWL
jgi:hypothetical protein